jgi:Flp pilus assembly protein TadD
MGSLFRAHALAATLLLAMVPAYADDVDDATVLFKQGKHAEALKRADALLAKAPKDARARFLKGSILAEQKKTDEAIAILRALTDEMPELPEPHNNLAVLYAQRGQYDDARRSLEIAILAHPGYALAHENLGDLYARMAGQSYRQAGKLDPKSASAPLKLKAIDQILGK